MLSEQSRLVEARSAQALITGRLELANSTLENRLAEAHKKFERLCADAERKEKRFCDIVEALSVFRNELLAELEELQASVADEN
jgi:hypothetical protein